MPHNPSRQPSFARALGLVSHTVLATFAVGLIAGMAGEARAQSAASQSTAPQSTTPQSAAPDQTAQATQAAPQTLPAITLEGQGGEGYKVDAASSPKQTAPLRDTPQTVTVVPQTVIQERGARNLTDVLRNTPGITFNAGENGFATSMNNFQLRGFDTSGNIFIDGVRDSGSYTRDVFNVERVEVFKGPAADNGRGNAGGYVNQVTKLPGLQSFIAGDLSAGFDQYGSEWRKRGTIDINQKVTDGIAVRLNAMIEDGGVAGRDVAKKNAWGIAPSVAFGLGSPFRAFFSYEHVEHDDLPDWGIPGWNVKGMINSSKPERRADRDNFYGLDTDYDDVNTDAIMARFEYDLADNVTISNQTRWARVDREARYTIPFNYNPGTQVLTTQTQLYDRVNTSIANNTNLLVKFDTGGIGHTLSTGLELMREWSKANRYPTNNTTTDIFDPDDDRFGKFKPAATEKNRVRVDTVAAYVYDTIAINKQWEITGGLRAEWYKVRIKSDDLMSEVDGFKDTEFNLGGKVGVVYKPVENGSIYAAFGVSGQSPGSYLSNPDISRTGDNAFPGFVKGAKGYTSYNYEIGTKWDLFNGRLSATAALFRTEKTGVPIVGMYPGDVDAELKGYGKQIVQGLEVGVAGSITDEWKVFGGFLLMDSKRKHSRRLDAALKLANPGDYGPENRTSGDELAFTPEFSASLWTTYRFPIGVTVGAGVQHVGSSFVGRPDDANRIIPNGIAGKLPSYTVFNAMLAYEITENVNIRLNVDNVFNEKYAVNANWNGRRVQLGAPRTFMISTGFQF